MGKAKEQTGGSHAPANLVDALQFAGDTLNILFRVVVKGGPQSKIEIQTRAGASLFDACFGVVRDACQHGPHSRFLP